MFAGPISASSQLEHAEIAADAFGRPFRLQMDDGVGDAELGALHCFLGCVLAYPKRRDCQSGETPGQVVEESSEISVVDSEVSQRLEAVDNDDAGTALLDQSVDAFAHAGQAVTVECVTEIVIENGTSDLLRVEERQRLPVAEKLVERLRHGREIDPGAFRRRVPEEALLGKDRLARSRLSRNQRDRVRDETATQDFVEASVSC